MHDERPRETRLHLKFSPIFVARLRGYAERHGMKLNAVVKKAFEHLEDHEESMKAIRPRSAADDYR